MTTTAYRTMTAESSTPSLGAIGSSVHATAAICRWNLRTLFRQWIFWGIFALGMLHFLLHFALIYTKAQLDVQQPELKRFFAEYLVTGDGRAYRDFLAVQSRAVMLLLAYAGVVSVVGDFRAGGLVFYMARPIGKLEYVLGKTLALSIAVGLLTLLPGLILFAEYGLFADSLEYWRNNPRILAGIVAYSLLIMFVLSLLAVALGAWCRRGTPFVMAWCALFIVLPVVGELLGNVFRRAEVFRLFNIWLDIRMIADRIFGRTVYRNVMPNSGLATLVIVALVVGCIVVLARRLKAVDVIE